ncbi:MAG: heavy-metal-associated domain-containing protein [Lachnospiraceae bacterium]|nr:heavy-metal-associated domain-containing protein [Lachnospiraceae bacterium]
MIKTTVQIDGMMCGMCESHVNDAIRKAFPEAKKVAASHTKKEATFMTDSEVDTDKLKSIIDETGYTFVSASSETVEKKGLFGFKK